MPEKVYIVSPADKGEACSISFNNLIYRPGDVFPAGAPAGLIKHLIGTGDLILAGSAPAAAITPPPAPKVIPVPIESDSPWKFNPDGKIKNLSLKALNRKIIGIDATVDPFGTVEEARAFLSSDFRP
jgi:hypothetical protein